MAHFCAFESKNGTSTSEPDGLYDALKEIVGMLNKYDDECDVIEVSYQFDKEVCSKRN